jgi:hypothetical protein
VKGVREQFGSVRNFLEAASPSYQAKKTAETFTSPTGTVPPSARATTQSFGLLPSPLLNLPAMYNNLAAWRANAGHVTLIPVEYDPWAVSR